MKRMRLNLLALTVLLGAGWLLGSPVTIRADGGEACCCIRDKCCCGDWCYINKYGICKSCNGPKILCWLGEIL